MQQDHWAAYSLALWNEITLGCVSLGTMKWKIVGPRTLRHCETKDHWAAYPSTLRCDENEWKACIASWWCVTWFMMFSWLDVSVCILVWMEHNICIPLQLDCIEWFNMVFHARCINMPMSLNGIEHMHIITTGLHMMIHA